jgi:tetratricopeptide (TPR) repeat protein
MMTTVNLFPAVGDLDRAFEQDDYEELKRLLPSHISIYPDDPHVIFFRGLIETDPAQAVKFYQRVVNDFPTSRFVDHAMFRLGQYYYFEGEYLRARRYFSNLFRKYPDSDLRDDAQYLYCQSILADGKVDSAKLFLKAFVQNAKRSPFVDAAILDVESLGGLAQEELTKPSKKERVAEYSIQVASYKNVNDAQNAKQKLARVFPHVKIGERTLGNTTYHRVLIGKFDSKEKAADYARLYIKPHLSEYKVIELTN